MTKKILLALISLSFIQLNAQTTATFESYLPIKDSFLNGSSIAPTPRLFNEPSERVSFESVYDTSFGGYWKGGLAVSSMTDTIDGTSSNLYSSANGQGAGASRVFLVGQQNARIVTFPTTSVAGRILSLKVSNTTYARKTMLNGNMFSKKFSALDKDSFVLWIYLENSNNDSIRVDLANFTNADTTKNFILDSWVKVEIPMVASQVRFKLVSSDNGQFGMNTPAFYAIDDVVVDYPQSINKIKEQDFSIYPNPCSDVLFVKTSLEIKNLSIMDISGRLLLTENKVISNSIDVSGLRPGIYSIEIVDLNGKRIVKRFVK